MPLTPGKGDDKLRHNIREMVKAGHPVKQAVAAAYREQRLAEGGEAGDAKPKEHEVQVEVGAPLVESKHEVELPPMEIQVPHREAVAEDAPAENGMMLPEMALADGGKVYDPYPAPRPLGEHAAQQGSDYARYMEAKRTGKEYHSHVPELRTEYERYMGNRGLDAYPEKREPTTAAEEIALADGGAVPSKTPLHERLVGVVENLFHHLKQSPAISAQAAEEARLRAEAVPLADNGGWERFMAGELKPADTYSREHAEGGSYAGRPDYLTAAEVGQAPRVIEFRADEARGVPGLAHGGTVGQQAAQALHAHLVEHVKRYAFGTPAGGAADPERGGATAEEAHPTQALQAPKPEASPAPAAPAAPAPSEHSPLDDIEAHRRKALEATEPGVGTRIGRALSAGLLGFAGRPAPDFAASDAAKRKEINAEADRQAAHYVGQPAAEAQHSSAMGESPVSARARLLAGHLIGDPDAVAGLSAQQVQGLSGLISAAVSQRSTQATLALKSAIEQAKLENEQTKNALAERKADQADTQLGINQQRADSYDYAAHKQSDRLDLERGDKVSQQLLGVRGMKDVQNAMEAQRRAENAEALLSKKGDLSLAEIDLLSQELGNIASGGHPSEAISRILAPDTLEGRLSAFKQYMSGEQGSAGLEDLRRAFADYLHKLKQVQRGTIARHTGTVLKLNPGVRPDLEAEYKKNPAFMFDAGQEAFDASTPPETTGESAASSGNDWRSRSTPVE